MVKEKTTKVYRTYTLDKDIVEETESYAKKYGYKVSAVINILLEKWNKKTKEVNSKDKMEEQDNKKS